MHFLVLQDGAIEDVTKAGLEVANQISVTEDFEILLFENVAIDFQDDVVHRQRAGFVGAQHIHRAEVLDGVQALHDDFLLRHGDGAFGQANRNDHR